MSISLKIEIFLKTADYNKLVNDLNPTFNLR